jgi:O-antigen/teichoic acid export membrane protein
MTLLISIIGVCCKPLVTILYGKEYVKTGLSMIILLIGIPFLAIGKVSSVYFYTNGKTRIHMQISFGVLLVNLVANFFLIPKYGIYGAAITSTVSYIFYAIVYLIVLSRYGIKARKILIVDKSDINMLKKGIISMKNKLLKAKNK